MSFPTLSIMDLPAMFFSLALFGLLLGATITDITRFRIPNVIPFGVVCLFLAKMLMGVEALPITSHLLMALVALLLGFLAFASGLLGGGDAKLIAALGLWFGPSMFGSFLTITGIGGGVFALLLLLVRRSAPWVSLAVGVASPSPVRYRLMDPKAPVPYAVPIACAACWLEWH